MKVLVNNGVRPSVGIVRSLGRRGIDVGVMAFSADCPVAHSRYCRTSYIVPPPTTESFVDSAIEIIRKDKYDLVIPVGYEATVLLARHKGALAATLETPDWQTIHYVAEKRNVYELARSAGVPVPRTVYPATLDDIKPLSSDLQYPVVIKALHESPGYTICYARTPTELVSTYLNFCTQKACATGSLPMIQEFVPGYGCGFFALYQNGVCKRIFMHRRLREKPPTGGVSTCAESIYDSTLKEYGTRLLDVLGWHGVAMVEFRRDSRDGTYKLMEINPRFWGSLDLALAAGVDFPYYICQMAQGHELQYSENYKRGVRYHWPLLELQHVWKQPSSLTRVVADLVSPLVKSNISFLDLGPTFYDAFHSSRVLLRRVRSLSVKA